MQHESGTALIWRDSTVPCMSFTNNGRPPPFPLKQGAPSFLPLIRALGFTEMGQEPVRRGQEPVNGVQENYKTKNIPAKEKLLESKLHHAMYFT